MTSFKQGELHLLVATTVIEVGVDVPNASLMIIENPERLGLAQLHQLRGRVGRGAVASHCVLLYKTPLSKTAQIRLQVLRDSNDGFVIAQKDLEIRGHGELLGTRQTGNAEFKVADLLRDQAMIGSSAHGATYSRTLPTTGKSPDRTLDARNRTLLECVKSGGEKTAASSVNRKIGNIKYSLITSALTISIKNAPTIGTTGNAMCDGPKRSVIACMLAIAVGVAPRPKPQ